MCNLTSAMLTSHNPNKPENIIQSVFVSLSDFGVSPTASSISIVNNEHAVNFLKHLPDNSGDEIQCLMLTLHCLFPHELIPALDLLDRKLVNRLTLHRVLPPASTTEESKSIQQEVFYIQSASAVTEGRPKAGTGATGPAPGSSRSTITATSRFRNALKATNTYYQVHLDSWNCSCPAFAYSTFTLYVDLPDASDEDTRLALVEETGIEHEKESNDCTWRFGGTLTNRTSPVPICKHILAALLGKTAPNLFGDGVLSRDVSQEELAGWSAGWGDHG